MDASREHSHCWLAPEAWDDDHYERWALNRTNSVALSRRSASSTTYNARPLSPESRLMSPTTMTSTFYTQESISELEAVDSYPQDLKSPYVNTPTSHNATGGIEDSDAKSAALNTLPNYFSKPLPVRPQR